jgi:hypothetical protein
MLAEVDLFTSNNKVLQPWLRLPWPIILEVMTNNTETK